MERQIRPGDLILITTSYTISRIDGDEISFYGDDGEDYVKFNPNTGKYMTGNSEVTGFEAGPEIVNAPIPRPIGQTYTPQPVTPVARPMYTPVPPVTRPAYTPVPINQPMMSPTQQRPKTSNRFSLNITASDFPPQVIKPGQTGFIWGLGVQYDEAGQRVRPSAKYRFRVLRSLRKGSNVILELDDGVLSTLTIRWRSEGTLGRGWMVRYKQAGNYYFTPVTLELD